MPRKKETRGGRKRTITSKMNMPTLRIEVRRLTSLEKRLRENLAKTSEELKLATQALKRITAMREKIYNGNRPSDWYVGVIALEEAERFFALRKRPSVRGKAAANQDG